MKAGQRRPWRSLLQRGVDTAGDLADLVAQRSASPSIRVPGCCAAAAVHCAGVWYSPQAVCSGVGDGAVGGLGLVYVAAGDYRHDCGHAGHSGDAIAASLPLAALGATAGAAARKCAPAATTGLGRATRDVGAGRLERGFFSLLGVMERGAMLPADEIRDLTAAANQTSAAMVATAAEVVSMERAVQCSEASRSYLVPTINAFTAQLSTGVRQYNEMVTAAAQFGFLGERRGWGWARTTALPRGVGRRHRSPGRLGAGV